MQLSLFGIICVGCWASRGRRWRISSTRWSKQHSTAVMQLYWLGMNMSGSLNSCWMFRNGANHQLLGQHSEQQNKNEKTNKTKNKSCRVAANCGEWVVIQRWRLKPSGPPYSNNQIALPLASDAAEQVRLSCLGRWRSQNQITVDPKPSGAPREQCHQSPCRPQC